jgi:dTDP-4-dehydrorhamnose reductase
LKESLGILDELYYIDELADLDVRKYSPDVVINTAGKTELKWCEDNAIETFRCNVIEPLRIWREIKKSALFINLSSGCVWDGPLDENGEPFKPTTPPNPACFYAWTKAACDSMMLRECGNGQLCILRPRQVYSPLERSRNTLMKLRSYKKLIDTPNSMTSAETIAKTIRLSIRRPALFKCGRILNVYDVGVTSPYKVGVLLAKENLRDMPELMTKDELDVTLKPKRVDVIVHDDWFENFVKPPKVDDELCRVAKQLVLP